MLDAFLASLETGEFDDNGIVRIQRIARVEHGLQVSVETEILGEEGSARTWNIDCEAVCDFRFLPSDPEPVEVVSEVVHPAIRQHTDPQADLVFTGTTESPDDLLGELWVAHTGAAGSWIPFERYLNSLVNVRELLSGRYGKLAAGPCFLLDVYAHILRNRGYSVSPFLPRVAVSWDGTMWRPRTAPLHMLRLGDSFVIAERLAIAR